MILTRLQKFNFRIQRLSSSRCRGSDIFHRGTFGSIRGSDRNEVVGLHDATIQGAVATDQGNGTERPVKINKTLAVIFLKYVSQ